jgi:hypothetical protein
MKTIPGFVVSRFLSNIEISTICVNVLSLMSTKVLDLEIRYHLLSKTIIKHRYLFFNDTEQC